MNVNLLPAKFLSLALTGLLVTACGGNTYKPGPVPEFSHSDPNRILPEIKEIKPIQTAVVYFNRNSSIVPKSEQQKLKQFMGQFGEKEYQPLVVEGHSDWVNTDMYNLKLSQKRADNVKKALTQLGYPQYQLNEMAKGEQFPAASNHTENGRQLNRRVVVYPFTDE